MSLELKVVLVTMGINIALWGLLVWVVWYVTEPPKYRPIIDKNGKVIRRERKK